MGVDQYIDYKEQQYWDVVSGVDHVIDTLGPGEFEHELSVLKKGGRLLSLRTDPNKTFAVRNGFSGLKKGLFTLAGTKYDIAAKKQGKEYRFMFVRSDGAQLQKITEIVKKITLYLSLTRGFSHWNRLMRHSGLWHRAGSREKSSSVWERSPSK